MIIQISCSENEPDKIPPTISIISHEEGAVVNEFDTIVVDVDDILGIEMVEFQIYGGGVSNDFSEPYIYTWNTLLYGDYETCKINAIAHDLAGNIASSDTIEITIDNRINLWGNYFVRDTTTIVDLSGNQYSGNISPDIAKLINLENKISLVFESEEILPAAGQGRIAVQCRKDDDFILNLIISSLNFSSVLIAVFTIL